jgi:hypothetical protein
LSDNRLNAVDVHDLHAPFQIKFRDAL